MESRVVEAVVIGGGYAGLSAALYIARGRHRVVVLDAGLPRNRFSVAAHGFFGLDGVAPGEMLTVARGQLARYREVSVIDDRATTISGSDEAFTVERSAGDPIHARKVVLATGLADVLPDIPGLKERWGKSVLHCPYCHGYEFAGRRLGVLAISNHVFHQAQLIPNWGPTTLFLNGREYPDDEVRQLLDARAVLIIPEPVTRLHGEGVSLAGVELADDRIIALDALYVAPQVQQNSHLPSAAGCDLETTPWGEIIRVDALRQTTVPGIYAAGDCARWPGNAMLAAADGVMAGSAVSQALIASWRSTEVEEIR
jgi:thioredoxin reductase